MPMRGTINPPLVVNLSCLAGTEADNVAFATCLLVHREVDEFVRLLYFQAFNRQATHKKAYRSVFCATP